MTQIPRLPGFDHSLDLVREGYDFLPRRFQRLDADVIELRLLLQPTIALWGREGAELFYDQDRFQREGAAPNRIKKTLFGEGGVQSLDGEAHRQRKAMFMSVMDDASIARLVAGVEAHWRAALDRWAKQSQLKLLVELRKVLTRAVCEWAGVPLPESEVEDRAELLADLVEGAGGVGPRHWKGRVARTRANLWSAGVIKRIRAKQINPPELSAAHVIAWHREQGELLSPKVAAVELINVLRPTVAIDRYISFAALSLHQQQIRGAEAGWDWADPRDLSAFVHEVRRYHPFFPFVAAKTRTAFEWRGYSFPKGRRVLLDLYGTNHDGRIWADPEAFRPERFRDRDVDAFSLIPQGGGDHHHGHRCAGEWITIAVIGAAVRLLTREMRYVVSDQNLRVDHGYIPARPADGFMIEAVEAVEAPVEEPVEEPVEQERSYKEAL